MAAQARVVNVQEAQQAEVIEKLPRPQPRPLPPGLRLSPDSDDGFNLLKHHAKVVRALERHAAENPPMDPATPIPHSAHNSRRGGHMPTVLWKPSPLIQSVPRPAVASVKSNQKAIPVAVEQAPVIGPQTHAPAVQPLSQKPPSIVSPGGRHYSGLFPSAPPVTLTGPGVFPPQAARYSAHFQSSMPVSEPDGNGPVPGLQSGAEPNEDNSSEEDKNPESNSSPPPIQHSSDPFEDRIIRLCVRHGLDPNADYQKMACAYLAAKKKRQADEEGEQTPTNQPQGYIDNASNKQGKGNGGGGGGSGGGGGGGGGGSGGGNSGGRGDSDNEEHEGSGDEASDERYGPEHDAWLIDPDTNNALAPCTYHFQTAGSAMRYYGPPPVFVGSNSDVECYTTYRWNKAGVSMTLQRIAGGFQVPCASIWQRADARREADRQRTEHLAAGLIQPHNDNDDDSGLDYGATQNELKTKGKPADSDLERESDVGSPVKTRDKGKGREVPAIPLTDKGKSRAKPAAAASPVGTGGRPTIAELATCDALGANFHRSVTDLGLLYGRRPEVILARLGLAPAPTRHTSIWNAFQTWFALQVPEILHDGSFLYYYVLWV